MEKVTKKELARKIEVLEKFSDYADNMLTQLNHALPEPLEIKHWRDEQADHDELMEILDSKEPKLKQLDQSVFDGLDSDYMFAAIDGCTGRAYAYEQKPHIPVGKDYWRVHDGMQHPVDYDYDTTNWQNSLIERNKVELTGSDLCRAMLERGDKAVLCAVSDDGDFEADAYDAICRVDEDGLFESHCSFWCYVRPVNNQGKPLTATDVGL